MGKIVGTGSLIVDIAGYAPHLPVDGETTLGSTLKLGPGGKGSNQLTAAHRAGAEVRIISKIGKDFLADIMLSHYKNEGMSTEYIGISETGETASAIIEVNEQTAQNRIIVIKGANDEVTVGDVLKAEKDFADCDVVLTQLETSFESILACKELAQKYNKPFVLNTAPFQEVPDGLIEGCDYITPNETEASFFSGVPVNTVEDAKKAADVLLKKDVKNVIITLGKMGVYFKNMAEEYFVPAIEVDAVDTTGAGDAFNGGFATALSEGFAIPDALRFATCVAALSVTKKGTSPAMPFKEEIYALFHKEYGIDLNEKYGRS
ncbi:MAG: ribokinase [Ruminococcaceae bacterium]|nr:ribokinase [Oscillospiraceae bacterium]